jgi:sugar lactone lactonase YvrE
MVRLRARAFDFLLAVAIASSTMLAMGSARVDARATRYSPATRTASLTYVSASGCNCVRVYDDAQFKQIDEISGLDGPSAIATDTAGNLWVVNASANDVLAFHRGSKKPFVTLPAAGADAIVVGDDGTVYVESYLPPTITVFAPTTGSRAIVHKMRLLETASGITLDAEGDLLVTGTVGQGGRVIAVDPKSFDERLLPGFFADPTAIVVDAANDRVVSDANDGTTYVLPPGESQPSRVLGAVRAARPVYSAFDANRTRLFVGDTLHAELDVFDYATGRLDRKVPEFGGYGALAAVGVATSPRAPF